LTAPFKKTARRTGIPNGTKSKGSVDAQLENETEQLRLVLRQYTGPGAETEWLPLLRGQASLSTSAFTFSRLERIALADATWCRWRDAA
jgi:hypothetical protein